MRKRRLWRYMGVMLLTGVVVASGGMMTTVAAETSSSTNYKVTQTQFGSGSTSESCSDQYCAQTGIASGAAGSTAGSTTTATLGPVTGSNPQLVVTIDEGTSDLGVLSTDTTATKTSTVHVVSYLSGGYVLQILGDPPKYNGHTLAALTTPTASQPGTEQFGINAVANTTPSVGANPVQVPSSQTSFGVVNDDYKTPNLFKYVSGDDVAHSPKASGETDYTISMILNIANSTPAGRYAGDFSAVVIPVY